MYSSCKDQVATSVAGVIEPTLQVAEAARSAERPTTDLTAYDLYLRAHALADVPRALDGAAQRIGLVVRGGSGRAEQQNRIGSVRTSGRRC